jgi:mRNA-degrading endonuclease YafQ of YafQ-DinJ toxin-antitoxin module
MWRLGRTEAFVRAARRFLRRRPQLEAPVGRALALLEEDPFDPRLHTHALTGGPEGLHGVRVTYQVRLIVTIDPAKREVVLLDLGDHDAVYR